jgi:CarD family transcriptional regulator
MISVGDTVIYPGHGPAKILKIETLSVRDKEVQLFHLKILNKNILLKLPKNKFEELNIRKLASMSDVKKLFDLLYATSKPSMLSFAPSNWNKRLKSYNAKIETGSLTEIGSVFKSLMEMTYQKELSFGENKLLKISEKLLVNELMLILNKDEKSILSQLYAPFRSYVFQNHANIKNLNFTY